MAFPGCGMGIATMLTRLARQRCAFAEKLIRLAGFTDVHFAAHTRDAADIDVAALTAAGLVLHTCLCMQRRVLLSPSIAHPAPLCPHPSSLLLPQTL